MQSSILPDLPRILKKTEAHVTPIILDWFRQNYKYSCAIEIKQTKGNTIPYGQVMDHQRLALLAAKTGLTHKLSDAGRMRQPFDAFQLVNAPGFVVACFIKYKVALVIPIEEWKGCRYDNLSLYTIKL